MKKRSFIKFAAACASLALSATSVSAMLAGAAGVAGDANLDGIVNMGDAVLIMQSLANPDTYHLTDQGLANADVYKNGSGITGHDAVAIQKFLLRITDKLPVA